MTTTEPTRLLIAAMGGEGGGVLAGWVTEAALAEGLWVQRTSVPGVAQRTGATTYYIELMPRTGDRRPVFALNPSPGRVDVLLATELLEAERMVRQGYVTPDRTWLMASTHRVFTVDEKSAMSDGRVDPEAMIAVCERFSRRAWLDDLSGVAAANGCHLNAVLLGALAGSGALPVSAGALRAAVAGGGKAVEANLRGFDAGHAVLSGDAPPRPVPEPEPREESPRQHSPHEFLPVEAARLAEEGVARLTDYQDADYARLYLDRLKGLAERPGVTDAVLESAARHLALRMSYEDTFRVAQLKLRESRLAKVRAEARGRPGDIIDVTEYLKPGPEEIFGMLGPRLGGWLMGAVERRGWQDKSFPMKLRTTRFSGFIRLRVLAALRRRRRKTLRHAQEEAWIAHWLDRIEAALPAAPEAAVEIAEAAKLVRGYGATLKRGLRNFERIDAAIIAPGLDGAFPPATFADGVMQARLAALKDPEGTALDNMISAFQAAQSRKLSA